MKKTFSIWLGVLVFLLIGGFADVKAQDQVAPLPIDKDVRVGKLPNGLTYFIRHNEQPKERANFYIVQRVGSMQEDDNQAGLAHFLEHMAFNGSRHFEGKEMINYLERIGVKFGAELNAFTAFDETRYTIKDAPVNRDGVIDSCLLILRDWSDGISLLEEEIDNERGVIQEEWRQSESGDMRTITTMLKKTFPGLKYGNRLPIGNMDVIRNFTYQELRDYYQKWYRPDLQGLVIVGDVDVDYIEAQIKKTFGDMPAPVNPAERVYEEIPDREQPVSIVVTDPETTRTMISFAYSTDALPMDYKASVVGLSMDYLSSVISSMMNARFAEIAQKPDAPFVYAGASVGPVMGFVMTEDELNFTAIAHEGRTEEALRALVAEMKRAKEFGFTAAEYQRASTELVNSFENSLNSKENRTNTDYADEYSTYFTHGGYIPGIEVEYQLMSQLAQGVTVDVINQHFQQLTDSENLVVTLMGQEKEGLTYPTEEELLAQYNKALEQEVEAYTDEFAGVELMETLPEPGKLLSEEKDMKFGVTCWTFDNGAKVYLLPTDYKKNDIRLYAVSNGGYVAFPDNLGSINSRAARRYATLGGLADFSETDLNKVLAGKMVTINSNLSATQEEISATSSDKDVETMFQLIYLGMTALRADTEAFQAAIVRDKAMLKASAADPMTRFWDAMPGLLYPGNEELAKLTEEDLDKIDYAQMLDAFRGRFNNAGDFKFFLVGSFDKQAILPLVERYIGGLPGNHTQEADQTDKAPRKSVESNALRLDLEGNTAMAISLGVYVDDTTYGMRENMVFDILGQVLSQQFFKSIREDEGGTYGVAVQSDISEAPRGEATLLIFFQTNPDQLDHLTNKVKTELGEIVAGNINIDEYFNKTVLNMEKTFQQNQKENKYWLGVISNYYFDGENFHDNYLETLRSITIEDVKAALKSLLDNGRYLEQIGVAQGK
ncbi:MAG: insulinase family protein [Porphyromonas sp.]|nr:insulinase family protein [Porphyromonas sp.]